MKFRSIDIYNHCGVIERFRTRTAMSCGKLSLQWAAIGSCAAGCEYVCLSYKMTAFFTTERILNVLKACLTLTNKIFPPWSIHTREITQVAAILILPCERTWGECNVRVRGLSEGRSGKDRRRSWALNFRTFNGKRSSARPTGKFPEKVENRTFRTELNISNGVSSGNGFGAVPGLTIN